MPILKKLQHHKVLFDTHVILWILINDERLSSNFRQFYKKAIKTQGVLISPMSIWEIGMLVEKKRIQLDRDVLDWVDQMMEIPGLNLSPITPEIAIQSSRLPGEIHGDPVDRLLIATAYEENAALVTCDQKILEFGKGKFISVFDPTVD